MIVGSFYLSDENNIPKALKLTQLAFDELEQIVGRFNKSSHRCDQLRGEVITHLDGTISIRHHFTKKEMWNSG